MDDLPQPNYSKPASLAALALGLSCLGMLVLGGALFAGLVFATRRSEVAAVEQARAHAEALARREEAAQRELASRATLILAAASSERAEVEATAEVLRERMRLAGIEGQVGVRPDLKLQIQLPGADVESALDLLLAGGDLQFKLVSTLEGEARAAAVREVEAAKEAGSYDAERARYDVGHTREGEAVLLENPGVPGYLLTKVYGSKDANGDPAIGFEFGEQGRAEFGELTGQNLQRNLAIVLDGVVFDTPTILSRIEGAGIINNPGGFATEVRERLITVLQSGKLPVDLDLESQTAGE